MKPQHRLTLVCIGLALLAVHLAGAAQAAPLGAIAEERLQPSQLILEPFFEFGRVTLTVEGPAGYFAERDFEAGEEVRFELLDDDGRMLPDGRYSYFLRLTPDPPNSSNVQTGLFFVNEGSGVSRTDRRDQLASIRQTLNREQQRSVQPSQWTSPISQYDEGLTLIPPSSYALSIDGDLALGGYVFREGKSFLHNIGGFNRGNTALGLDALANVTPEAPGGGSSNTAVGKRALFSNTTGHNNTASGVGALYHNTTGSFNSANGDFALNYNTTGSFNTACGSEALYFNIGGDSNTAVGYGSLRYHMTGNFNTAAGAQSMVSGVTGSHNTAIGFQALRSAGGSRNVGIGYKAGVAAFTGDDNIFIASAGVAGDFETVRIGTQGTQTRAFMAGISGVAVASGEPVVVDSNGQLGVAAVSSLAHKKEIQDMGESSSSILQLRPITFRYRQDVSGADDRLQYGLLADEVAEVNPDLVLYSDDGEILGVRYHLLAPLLLNELQNQHRLNQEQGGLLANQRKELELLRNRLEQLEALVQPAPNEEGG